MIRKNPQRSAAPKPQPSLEAERALLSPPNAVARRAGLGGRKLLLQRDAGRTYTENLLRNWRSKGKLPLYYADRQETPPQAQALPQLQTGLTPQSSSTSCSGP